MRMSVNWQWTTPVIGVDFGWCYWEFDYEVILHLLFLKIHFFRR